MDVSTVGRSGTASPLFFRMLAFQKAFGSCRPARDLPLPSGFRMAWEEHRPALPDRDQAVALRSPRPLARFRSPRSFGGITVEGSEA
jgi:hypothetical protein